MKKYILGVLIVLMFCLTGCNSEPMTEEELAFMDYRSKIEIEGQVRIVRIPGYDVCACCAPHVSSTAEVGIIKLLDFMKHRGGVRIVMKAGKLALLDYRDKAGKGKLPFFRFRDRAR